MSGEELFGIFDDESQATTVEPPKRKPDAAPQQDEQERLKRQRLLAQKPSDTAPGPQQHEQEEGETGDEEAKEQEGEKASKRASKGMISGMSTPSATNVSLTRVVNTTEEELACLHDLAVPEGWEEPKQPETTKKPAKTYPFSLDPFQSESIKCLEKGQSVLVAAHTSAGKTVVAEYAIALCLRDAQRVVYTCPIKALSNQKYRDLSEEFGDVGLMTGDVTINPNASCMVMTTEILRSMLYRGSEMIREIAWVIFDEVHYMRDKERGVVWEESIIMMPNKVRFVFLSATIPNAPEFAKWICTIHNQPCHVIYTDYRPVPLEHYIFPKDGDGLHLVVDMKRTFRDDNFQKALACVTGGKEDSSGRIKQRNQGNNDLQKIISQVIIPRSYGPCLVFCFAKRECERNATKMTELDLNTDDEKGLVDEVYTNAIDSLNDDDKKLPQVENILPMLRRGIGVHHSGLLPIVKEVVEILFQEGLLKVLFSTETFSIGLNMPAKTVVFTSVRKFDGTSNRWVTGGEYVQMSGRAGRRGLDEKGIVILMVDEKMEPAVAKGMVKGHADQLDSSFHLGYNMLLNLLRTEEADPELMIRNSFHQFQADRAIPQMKIALSELREEYDGIKVEDEERVGEYHQIRQQLSKLKEEMRQTMIKPDHALQFMQPGRLIHVKDEDRDWGWGVVVNFQKKSIQDKNNPSLTGPAFIYYLDVLLLCSPGEHKNTPARKDEKGEMRVVPVALPLIHSISKIRIYLPRDLRSRDSRGAAHKSVREVQRRFPDGLPLLDPIEDMKITSKTFKTVVRKVESLEDRLLSHSLFEDPSLPEKYSAYDRRQQLRKEMKLVQKQIKASSDLCLKDDLKAMRRLLRRMGHINSDHVVQMKGRVACEISAADEILVTELIFNGVFNDMPVEKCVALLVAFVCDEQDKQLQLSPEMAKLFAILTDTARSVAKVMVECKVNIDPEEYEQSFKPSLMDVVFAWCKGAKFAEICKMTAIFEGSIIRAMRRLEELLRQVMSAAKAVGDNDLEAKFAKGMELLRRDIVFAASLYL